LEVNAWNDFEGKIGNKETQISLYLFKDSTVKGNYVSLENGVKIPLNGHLKANVLFLNEFNDRSSSFRGNLFSDTLDKFEGVYTDSLRNKSLPFYFNLSAIDWGDYARRYTNMYGTNEEIEQFMKVVKNAILSDNKQWVANHVHYPTKHVLHKRYTSITNKYQMIKYFDQIFNKDFKKKIGSAFTTNLFNKNGEAMLGHGEIWISNGPKSTEDNYSFLITAINQ